LRTCAERPLAPGVIARPRHAVNTTHHCDFVLGPVCFNQFEDFFF
jgi:hypothetical protein